MSEREITVRKQASGSNLRDGARPTFLDKKNLIELFNVTYAELSMMREQLREFIEICTRNSDRRPALMMILKIERKMNEMIKIQVA